MKLNPEDVPNGYSCCFATDEQCPQRKECLHALVAELPLKPSKTPERILAIDPRYVATLKGKGGCYFYRSAALKQYARGMSQMFDAVPGKLLGEVRKRVQNCFTCRSYYFASRKGDRLISPNEQKLIADVFQQLCPDIQPVYDDFEKAYEW